MHPFGGTPLYKALSELIRKTEKGKTITVMSDGEDTGGYVLSLESDALKKNITVNWLNMSGYTNSNPEMRDIVNKTGGKLYETH